MSEIELSNETIPASDFPTSLMSALAAIRSDDEERLCPRNELRTLLPIRRLIE
jgi:hypothetical protein